MLERVLPDDLARHELFTDPSEARLFAEESAVIARAVDKRRREFATVRHCARIALAEIGAPIGPLLPGARGAPGWPPGVVGSMTHCAGYRAAVVAWDKAVRTIGIDAEPHEPLPDGVLDAVSLPAEKAMISALPGNVHWDRILFSAKESVYKSWFPLSREWLDFEEAEVTLSLDGTFHAHLLKQGYDPHGAPLTSFTGRWLAENGLIITAIVDR
ncbi:4'-phosphopantetheinyl transferase superfamily protein [Saccharopolyspora karakumensis]|uniref:4'-phosphopantetheinyl transferase superfamily protein n=1 Tax=Saccharopolyspora karakumensis TaxID=2530386 RepID=A0A4R5BM38_9PSEU|nr:4'-phosphopantetheinyl transferase superfamily protein [Saccharopolyspora karakumensis]TDD87858.1 4'-phosphopantetheinyl transferase superfamily protein [Saccharopolyspora karakumensis]